MLKHAVVALWLGWVCVSSVYAGTKEKDEQDAISLSLATQKKGDAEGLRSRSDAGLHDLKTPLAQYNTNVRKAIGSRWFYYVQEAKQQFQPQSIKVAFTITKEGAVTGVKSVDDESSTERFKNLCLKAVRDTVLPPFSDALQRDLGSNLVLSFHFVIRASPEEPRAIP